MKKSFYLFFFLGFLFFNASLWAESALWYDGDSIELSDGFAVKGDEQFDRYFPLTVIIKTGIKTAVLEPEWELVKSSWMEEEEIEAEYPSFMKMAEDSGLIPTEIPDFQGFKYNWKVKESGQSYVIMASKFEGDKIYHLFLGRDVKWCYTLDFLSMMEAAVSGSGQ